MYVTPLLDFCTDPLSDVTPTWTSVTAYLLEAEWGAGKSSDMDAPQAGTATFRLDNRDRRFEPSYAAGAFYPNVVPLRRFRLRVQNGVGAGTIYDEGIWYVTSWGPTYEGPGGLECVVQCVDGFELLSLDTLELMDPPDASSYEEVVNHDEPSFYYRLGEPEGTKLVSHLRSKRWLKNHPHAGRRRRRYRTVETRAELGGVSGPSGTYKGNPTLGAPSLILGDSDTSVRFDDAASQYARVPLDQSDLIDRNVLTVEVWADRWADTDDQTYVGGPNSSAISESVFYVAWRTAGGGTIVGNLSFTDGSSLFLLADDPGATHICFTWNEQTGIVYGDGVELARADAPGKILRQGSANDFLYIGRRASGHGATAYIDEVALYEKALPPERILAHYTAGSARGFAEQTAGARILAIATHDLWAETKIQAGSFNVQPMFEHGQAKLEEIMGAADSEQPDSHFFFDGVGDPVYLGWDFQGSGTYGTPQQTFGWNAGEVPFEDLTVEADDELWNDVTVSRDGGEAQTVTDATSQAAYRRRAMAETGLSLSSDTDARKVAQTLLDRFSDFELVVTSLTLNGADSNARTQILTRQIGDLIRVKHRPKGGTAIDRVAHILGYRKQLTAETGELFCTWNLARGFNAGAGLWQLGINGFTELGATAVLG